MKMVNYELAQAHIADLKALNPPEAAWQRAGLRETLGVWWPFLKKPAPKVAPAYRAELLRQEWMVVSEPVNTPRC